MCVRAWILESGIHAHACSLQDHACAIDLACECSWWLERWRGLSRGAATARVRASWSHTMATGKTKDGRGAFLFSPTLDAAAFLLPISLAILFTPTAWLVPKQQVPLWAHLILVVSNDVAHVWATAFRVYLDRREFVRRAAFYTAAPIVAFVVAFTLHYFGSATHFWTALAYYAMFHFVKQDFGLIALFVARSGIRPTKQQMQREKITLYVGAGVPVLLWHGSRPEAFRWFSAGERFIFTTPEPLVPPLVFMYAATLLTYVANELWQWRRGAAINAGKLFVMSAAWVTWGVGVGFEHEVLSLAWINLFHGIPYMVMIGVYCRNRWACLPPSACSDQVLVFLTQRWQVFVAALVGVAMLEDVLWDLFVWQVKAHLGRATPLRARQHARVAAPLIAATPPRRCGRIISRPSSRRCCRTRAAPSGSSPSLARWPSPPPPP